MSDTNKQKNLIGNLLFFIGLILALIGAYIVAAPEHIAHIFFKSDIENARILGVALLFLGITDSLIIRKLFMSNDRK